MKFFNIQNRFDRYICLLSLIFIISLSVLLGCTFGGGHQAPLGDLGTPCIRAATQYAPTPTSLAPSGPQALPLTEEGCENSLEGVDVKWEFVRTDISNSTPIIVNHWQVVNAATSSGEPACIFKVFVPTEAVKDKGLGTWQVTHKADDWSVTCPNITIIKCRTDESPAVDFWTSHTTIGQEGCIQQEIGLDIVEPGFP
ncbi:MAG: hypothetical protein DHS20C13_00510 [Thermodesulfobacteriota bacterium]|nr:MAG: hypothetical protein DHS20C13_00510 [Thermodesulfobacteriota bacterium]